MRGHEAAQIPGTRLLGPTAEGPRDPNLPIPFRALRNLQQEPDPLFNSHHRSPLLRGPLSRKPADRTPEPQAFDDSLPPTKVRAVGFRNDSLPSYQRAARTRGFPAPPRPPIHAHKPLTVNPTDSGPLLSVVIPVRDEEESIPVLGREMAGALDEAGLAWEAVWVDDGSRDGSAGELACLAAADPRHRWLRLAAHQGKAAALAAGFEAARGELIATLDGDLQNDPHDLPLMVALLQSSAVDVVIGVRTERKDPLVRRVSSRIGNRFRDLVTGDHVTDVGCGVRVFRARFARGIPTFAGMHRFLPTLMRLRGARVREIPVRHRPRVYGRAKYGIINRFAAGIVDTLGVLWLRLRWTEPRVDERSPVPPPEALEPDADPKASEPDADPRSEKEG